HHPAVASASRTKTSPLRVRAAANAVAISPPRRPASDSCRAAAVIGSSGPGEIGLRQARLALVLDAERVDPRPLGLRHRQVRADRVEHPREPDRLAGLN